MTAQENKTFFAPELHIPNGIVNIDWAQTKLSVKQRGRSPFVC